MQIEIVQTGAHGRHIRPTAAIFQSGKAAVNFLISNQPPDFIEKLIVKPSRQTAHFGPCQTALRQQLNRAASVIAGFAQFMPKPLLTPDQLILLKSDNVAAADMPGFDALGLTPMPIEAILPDYLARYRPQGKKTA